MPKKEFSFKQIFPAHNGMKWIYPRWMHAIYAHTHLYFWMPCPICRKKLGGHEESGSWYIGNGQGRGVCINCKPEANKRNAEFERTHKRAMIQGYGQVELPVEIFDEEVRKICERVEAEKQERIRQSKLHPAGQAVGTCTSQVCSSTHAPNQSYHA